MYFLTLCPINNNYQPVVSYIDFVGFLSVAAFLAIPVVIFVFLWRNFAVNAPAGLQKSGLSPWALALYILAGFATFTLGVLAFQAVQAFS